MKQHVWQTRPLPHNLSLIKDAMENERRTEYNVDMRPEEDFLSDILSASQIRATDTYETPPQIIWIDNSTIATLGNFSASTGKAKSKKHLRFGHCRCIAGRETSAELPGAPPGR